MEINSVESNKASKKAGEYGRGGEDKNFNRVLKKHYTEWVTFKLRPEGGEEVKHIKIERDGYSKLNE